MNFRYSPLNRANLKASFQTLDLKMKIPTRVGGTRWLPHTKKAIDHVLYGYNAIIQHLEQVRSYRGLVVVVSLHVCFACLIASFLCIILTSIIFTAWYSCHLLCLLSGYTIEIVLKKHSHKLTEQFHLKTLGVTSFLYVLYIQILTDTESIRCST